MFPAYTAVFGVETEAAAAASIVMWLITFAACSLAGVPLLIHEGFSLGNCGRWRCTKKRRRRKRGAARRVSPVKCPFCAHVDDKVIDSREGRLGDTIRRRRECLKCGRRFTTYERIDEIPYMVIKKDGRRERFERQKILQGLLKACEKRPVPTPKLEAIVDEIEGVVQESTERELTTTEIGE